MKFLITAATAALTIVISTTAQAFCGFYVARADTGLFNEASQVVLVRDGDRTVITMANDFQGDVKNFAVVIPVPTFIEREQINVADRALVEHLDAYTAPRLVEYWEQDPCSPMRPGFGGLAVALAIRPTLEDLMGGIPRCLPVGFIQPVTVTSDRRRSRFSMSTTK